MSENQPPLPGIRPISALRNWDQNPRSITTEDFERLKRQIKQLGVYKPLLITKDGTVLGGNMRLRAYKELGITEVPVTIVDAPDDKTKLEYALSDNDRAGTYDEQMLAELITNTPDIELGDYKVDLGDPVDLQALLDKFGPEPEIEEDEAPEPPVEAKSNLGEVYQLGRHRLMCGDATKIDDVEKLMDGAKADMVFTDPPYGIDYQDTKGKFDKIANDDADPTDLIYSAISIHTGVPAYLCCNWRCMEPMVVAMKRAGLEPKACIVWDKETRIQNLDKFYKQHEFILYSGPYGGEPTIDGDVWRMKRETRNDHPTSKPVELCAKAIGYSSLLSGNVVDPFGGSGSTLIACEQTNRTAFLMELDPRYVDVILTRWSNLTGEDPVRVDDGKKWSELNG